MVALSFYWFSSILKWPSLQTDHNFYYKDCTFLRIILQSNGLGLSIDACDHCNFIKCTVGFVCKNAKIQIFRSVYLHSVSPVVNSHSVEGSLTIVVHSKLIFICLLNSHATLSFAHFSRTTLSTLHHSPQRPKNNENEHLCKGKCPYQLTLAQQRNQLCLAPQWINQE